MPRLSPHGFVAFLLLLLPACDVVGSGYDGEFTAGKDEVLAFLKPLDRKELKANCADMENYNNTAAQKNVSIQIYKDSVYISPYGMFMWLEWSQVKTLNNEQYVKLRQEKPTGSKQVRDSMASIYRNRLDIRGSITDGYSEWDPPGQVYGHIPFSHECTW